MTSRIHFASRWLRVLTLALFLALGGVPARAEVMLQLFNVNWDELHAKLPEIAEAGYTALWLPPPAKAGSVYSVGYDLFDPFDLGDKNQRGTVRTRYGTKEQLQQVVELAHRLGIRVYFDNIMNHRGFDIPGFNSSTPTNIYPGLSPKDFHLMTRTDGYLRNWPGISDADYNNGDIFAVQHKPLFGLIDLATEGGNNANYGPTYGSTTAKPVYIRQPTNREYYMDTNLPLISGTWRPFNGTNGDPVLEDVNAYLIRAAMWMLNETKCDGFRFDAVKHIPAPFFGNTSATPDGYTGALQAMYDAVHGYGNNVLGNGYVEGDDSRNSCFDAEAVRNDAMLFGEHQGQPPPYGDYIIRGMRLIDSPLRDTLNGKLGNPGANLIGLEQRDSGGFAASERVMYAQSHDNGFSSRRELQVAYMLMREGIAAIYSDGYNQSGAPDYFPAVANAPYLGEFGDNKMPDMAYLHNQLARGGTRPRWGDNDIVAFERYDYRETTNAFTNPDATVVLFAMNDNYGNPGDTSFDDGVTQSDTGMPSTCYPVLNSRGVGLVVGFPPGSWLSQLADSPGADRACPKVLVRQATAIQADAEASKNDPNPVNRKVYIGGQTLAPGGGAIECKIPSGGYVAYGYQWPEASRAQFAKSAVTLRQNGVEAPRVTILRKDGVNGDNAFNPVYPFKMRGSVNKFGAVVPGVNVTNKTYAIDVPILTNALFDIVVRSDASAVNMLFKLDGGVDLNSHVGLGPTNAFELRDNRPGAVTDVFLGYEQAQFNSRFGPEKFAARDVGSNTIVSLGAETYHYTIGSSNHVVSGNSFGVQYDAFTADWVQHNPTNLTTVSNAVAVTQRNPVGPATNQAVDVWVKVGFKVQINRCFIYYTTDGTNPEGAFGIGSNSTKVVEANFAGPDSVDGNIDWWKGVLPASNHTAGAQIRYKVALFKDNIAAITDAEDAKLFGLTQFSITNFNPTTATVWLHNDRNTNNTVTGLREGFHILRGRAYLPRTNKSSVYNTFLQTFYYDAVAPQGVIATPATNNVNISNTTFQVVVRADASVTSVEFNIQDGDPGNDDAVTGGNSGNGLTNGQPKFVAAVSATANTNLSALYPDYPLEFRFSYTAVPTSGVATITARLKEASTAVFPTRVTTLERTVNTVSPGQTLLVANPATDGQILSLATNEPFTIAACFSSSLATFAQIDLFSIYANGVFLPRRETNGTPFYTILASGCDVGQRQLVCNWSGALAGTNSIQFVYTNNLILSDTRSFLVVRPGDSDGDGMTDDAEQIAGTDPFDPNSVLRITALADGYHLVVWDSVPGVNYQVLAGTNLNDPLQVISPVIPAGGNSSFYFDNTTNGPQRYFRVQVVY